MSDVSHSPAPPLSFPPPLAPAADLDLRLVRSFVAVAEHRHFGRAAAAVHLTQSSLSRQIARLEQQVGARLLDRTPTGTRLTEAGEVFLPLAVEVLRSAAHAAASAQAADQPNRITIGFTSNIIVTPAVRELRRQYPDADVRTPHLPWQERHMALLDHRVDAMVTRLPFPTDQLTVTVLYDEPRVLLVPVGHRLAGKESVALDDIADEPLPRSSDPAWNAFWRIDPRPDGSCAPAGPLLDGVEDKLELVASGQAIAIVPANGNVGNLRPDLTTVPLRGVGPSQVVLAVRANDHAGARGGNRHRDRLVAAFRACAKSHLAPPPLPQRVL